MPITAAGRLTYIYRAFGKDGRLLYIGITEDFAARARQHNQNDAVWLDHLDHFTLEMHATRISALTAESQAIRSEWPLYNVDRSPDQESAERLRELGKQRGGPSVSSEPLHLRNARVARYKDERSQRVRQAVQAALSGPPLELLDMTPGQCDPAAGPAVAGEADRLSSRDAAAFVGITPSTWRDYVADGRAPKADGKMGSSHWWCRETVEQWNANRPGRGARTDLKGN